MGSCRDLHRMSSITKRWHLNHYFFSSVYVYARTDSLLIREVILRASSKLLSINIYNEWGGSDTMWWSIWLGNSGRMSNATVTKYRRRMATVRCKHKIPHWRNCWNAIHRHIQIDNTNEDGFVNESASSCSGGCKSKRLDIYSSCHTNCSWRWCKRAYFV